MIALRHTDSVPDWRASPLRAPRRLRVMMTVDAVGGVWRYAMELAKGLAEQDVESVFAVLGPRPSAHQAAEAEALGTIVMLDQPLDWMARAEEELEPAAAALERAVVDLDADVLQVNVPSQAFGLDLAIPIVAVAHSCVATWWRAVRGGALPEDWRWQASRTAGGLGRVDAIVAPSAAHSAALRACYGEALPVTVVHNAASFDPPGGSKEPFVLAAGRWWDEGKDGRTLDRAARHCAWPVAMAGALEGPNGQRLDIDYAEVRGELPAGELRSLMARAGIFVSPSVYEPFGLAPLEAARSRCALVLADLPVFRELWDGAALFFPPHDARALAAAVNRLAGDAELRTGLAAVACLRSLMFTPREQAQAMRAIYERTLSGTGAELEPT